MPKYKVHFELRLTGIKTVEAEDEDEAAELVEGMNLGDLESSIDDDRVETDLVEEDLGGSDDDDEDDEESEGHEPYDETDSEVE